MSRKYVRLSSLTRVSSQAGKPDVHMPLTFGILPALAALSIAVWNGTSHAADNEAAAPLKATQKDPFRVPDGTIEDLQKYIDGLRSLQPSSSLRPAMSEFRRKRAAAQLAACEKILKAKPTYDQVRPVMRAQGGSAHCARTARRRLGHGQDRGRGRAGMATRSAAAGAFAFVAATAGSQRAAAAGPRRTVRDPRRPLAGRGVDERQAD